VGSINQVQGSLPGRAGNKSRRAADDIFPELHDAKLYLRAMDLHDIGHVLK